MTVLDDLERLLAKHMRGGGISVGTELIVALVNNAEALIRVARALEEIRDVRFDQVDAPDGHPVIVVRSDEDALALCVQLARGALEPLTKEEA